MSTRPFCCACVFHWSMRDDKVTFRQLLPTIVTAERCAHYVFFLHFSVDNWSSKFAAEVNIQWFKNLLLSVPTLCDCCFVILQPGSEALLILKPKDWWKLPNTFIYCVTVACSQVQNQWLSVMCIAVIVWWIWVAFLGYYMNVFVSLKCFCCMLKPSFSCF